MVDNDDDDGGDLCDDDDDDGDVGGIADDGDDGDDGDGVKLKGTCELSCLSQALSEFVDASETREDAVPRNILMAIMQLTEFLSKVILCQHLFSDIQSKSPNL